MAGRKVVRGKGTNSVHILGMGRAGGLLLDYLISPQTIRK